MMLLVLALLGGIMGVAWLKYRAPASPVDQEYKKIPDYFPPESGFRSPVRSPGDVR